MKQRPPTLLKFPLLRGSVLENAADWIERKKALDDIGDLWRIDDSLYDFTDFVSKHPGGKEWITFSRGTDITEVFESHHLKKTAEKLLPNFFVKQAEAPRNNPFTLENNGFYKTLKPKIVEGLSKLPRNIRKKSDDVTDSLFLAVLLLSPLSVWLWTLNQYIGSMLIISNALALSYLITSAHSYFHRSDNWRMYLFNLNGLSFEDWRITHTMSHHIFTNTSHDAELVLLEPFLQYLPYKEKSILNKLAVIYWPLIALVLCPASMARNLFQNNSQFRWTRTIPFFLLLWMYVMGGQSILLTATVWVSTNFVSSLFFTLFGLTSGHLTDENFFEGQTKENKPIDWGLHQLRTIVERCDYNSNVDHFKALTRFGDHVFHHLFPTLDHAEFQHLYPILLEHCKKFEVELRSTDFYSSLFYQVKQLTIETK